MFKYVILVTKEEFKGIQSLTAGDFNTFKKYTLS